MRIEKKILPEYFKKVACGDKNFELRLADWECHPGDVLILREWDLKTKQYTGSSIEKEVTCVLKTKDQTFFSDEDVNKYGFQVIGFK
ncbi:MAG: ASCH domain protein [Parcubacteria group bacterium GW2011_GWC2_39_14]|nr:MAG: ASCH domain protein [Parcubacteria group bacterium GW2011_GWC2_39_14]KKR55491.1 MAG: ASCH domain protein [Parcubacteria group bacterium GW2011_GWA2_40_23]